MAVREDDQLMSWDEVQKFLPPNLDPKTRGILLGNGASMAIWKRFHYSTLYEIACDTNRHPHLETSDQEVFGHLDTVNFEAVLSALITAGRVWAAFEKPSHDIDDIRRSYLRIKNVLIAAVRSVHAPYEKFGQDIKRLMSDALKEYGYVYTTNYDLLLYWSIMDQPGEFKDFFWNVDRENDRVWFDLGDTDEWRDNVTKVLYLHGSLHLCKHPEGTFKRMSSESGNILEQFDVQGEAIPLFISEGRHRDKLAAIIRNDYLSFSYEKFSKHRGSLVVFGHSLTEQFDQHLIDAMRKWRRYDQKRLRGRTIRRVIAVSMVPWKDGYDIVLEKTRLRRELGEYYELHFFNSETHPLGNPLLSLHEEPPDEEVTV